MPLKKYYLSCLLATGITLPVITASAQIKNKPDSITVAVAPDYNDVSGVHRILLGENYRKRVGKAC
ncbi:hypothetical protein [Mucilaginibacter terrae]|uniref:Uncharacterized protein n=1 Tax=Mucilaginibacter terrae TaxID=1955052 RepID=A0ABU3H180_9SPHI|nr:hypothetical protein [Mucilaginibacter terrae]MDT3404690.1 hypothetical protein [Mucilaginibacter terrae]